MLPKTIKIDRILLSQNFDKVFRDSYMQVLLSSRDNLKEWFPWARNEDTYARENVEARLSDRTQDWQHFPSTGYDFVYGLQDKTTKTVLGLCGAEIFEIEGIKHAEMGYWLGSGYEGQGYMSEAVTALSDALLKLDFISKVSIVCQHHNIGSRRVAEKSGFAFICEGGADLCLRDPAGDKNCILFEKR